MKIYRRITFLLVARNLRVNGIKVIKKQKLAFLLFLSIFTSFGVFSQVTFEQELLISEKGLFFDGIDVGTNPNAPDRGPEYDFAFGNRITPHGDCIKEYQGYVFMTWYRGGKQDRHVMLSRYNPNTGVVKSIEFPHRHTGYLNVPHIGESHNTIALGISPLDGTIHLLYDMHAYSENRPSDGSLANDYFRYSYSVKDAATVPDDQFNLNQFVRNNEGGFKHLQMRPGTDYRSLTYPNFFLNTQGELFMWIREGGNTNGAYKFCKYDGNQWSDFTSFNVLNASRNNGIAHNWGLYGDIKFESGKMRIGFARRSGNRNDEFQLNNGFYYAYSDDPNGLEQWKDHNGQPFSIPLLDSERIKASEPTDVLGLSAPNSIVMTSGADWTVTDNGDIHSITSVGSGQNRVAVHTYKSAGDTTFKTTTDVPGGDLYTYKNEVYLIGLQGGRVFVEKTAGGTNNWQRIYQSTRSKRFRHGNVHISKNGKLYFYLMERLSGSAQPLYLQILDLGLAQTTENQLPIVNIIAPENNATFSLGEAITITANANDTDGSIERVNFKVNDDFFQSDLTPPFSQTFVPSAAGNYKLAVRAFDNDGGFSEVFINITVIEKENQLPSLKFVSPEGDLELEENYQELYILVQASDNDGSLSHVSLYQSNTLLRTIETPPYEWGFGEFAPETLGLKAGEYPFRAVATDNSGGVSEIFFNFKVTPSIDPTKNEEIILIHPNPANNYFIITGGPEETGDLTVFDVNGKMVISQSIKPANEPYDISILSAGVYIVKLRYQSKTIYSKLIVDKRG